MIVVTAPTGSIGKKIVAELLDAGAEIRLIARDASKVELRAGRAVEIIEGSHSDGEVVFRATNGADAVFWLVPPNPKAATTDEAYSGFTRPGLAAMASQGVRRIVAISALGRGTPQENNAGLVTASLAMDDLIAESGVAYRAVTCPSFYDNLLRQVQSIREKGIFNSAVDPSRKLPGCATDDIAKVSAGLLLDDTWVGVGHHSVLGAADLSFDDMAAVMTEVLPRRIACVRTDYATYKQQFIARGWSDAMAQGQVDMVRAKSEGLDNGENRSVQNTAQVDFRRWCKLMLKPAVVDNASLG